MIDVEATIVEELGSATHVLFTIEAPPVDAESVRAASDDNERATLLALDRRALFTAEVAEGTAVSAGERLRLAVDPTKLHFFDPATGASLRASSGRRADSARVGLTAVVRPGREPPRHRR